MDANEKLDATHTETLIRFLAHRFGVPVPKLKFNGRGAGHYRPRSQRICFTNPPLLRVIVHEFAHHLADVRNPKKRGESHGQTFYCALKHVAAATYGQPERHDWKHEAYHTLIGKWAKRDQFLVT